MNIQNEKRDKVLKSPFEIKPKSEKIIVRMTDSEDLFVEDNLPYKEESEWLEIDSDEMTYFLQAIKTNMIQLRSCMNKRKDFKESVQIYHYDLARYW
jgi:hypothetical protein